MKTPIDTVVRDLATDPHQTVRDLLSGLDEGQRRRVVREALVQTLACPERGEPWVRDLLRDARYSSRCEGMLGDLISRELG